MKINNLTRTLFICAIAATGLASCGGDDNDRPAPDRGKAETVNAPAGYAFYVPTGSTGSLVAFNGSIDFYEKVKTADVKISLLNGNYGLNAPEIKYTVGADGIREIDAKSNSNVAVYDEIEATVGTVPASAISVDGAVIFSLEMKTRTGEITYIPKQACMMGKTQVTSAGSSFETSDTWYTIDFMSDGKANLTVHNAKFASNMPAVGDMLFSDLTATYSYGKCMLTSTSLIPSIAGVPYPSFAISNLSIDVEFDGDADIRFECNAMGRSYTVKADDMHVYPLGR